LTAEELEGVEGTRADELQHRLLAYIGAGTHTVELSLDDDDQVLESDETNNRFSVRVTVGGQCG
jgi:subtilase family serine protease